MNRFGSFCLLAVLLAGTPPVIAQDETPAQTAAQPAPGVASIAKQARESVVVIKYAGRDGAQQGMGTGFVVSADGLIATNLHVLGEARPLTVETADGKNLQVLSVHASDRNLDLALLRVEAEELPALELGDPATIVDGQPIVVMGNPHGLKHSVVSGVVSGRRKIDDREMLQLAIPIEPGNSGGPVLDMQGRVHGVVTIKSLVTENLGFAVPVNQLKPLIEQPNPIPMSRWLTIGVIAPDQWTPLFGANWQQRGGRILVGGAGSGFGGRSLCLWQAPLPERPYEAAVSVRMGDESGAAGLVFFSDGAEKHYGFYPSNGNLRLTRFEGPNVFTWRVLHDQPSEHYRPGEWNHLKVRLEEEKIICYVNDQLVLESADSAFTKGRVGLAKFRDTTAQFKNFQVGETVAPSQPDAELVEQLETVIANLPELAAVRPEQIAPLAESPLTGAARLRAQAKQLESRAEELRRLANDVHTLSVVNELEQVLSAGDDESDLLKAALLLARLDEDELDVDAYLDEVQRMADAIQETLAEDAADGDKLAALNKYLFDENGFHGSRTEYYHRANSYLNRVIDDREGLPITLSLLYMELGRRIGLNIEGVGLPGHFVARHVPAAGDPQLIDVFEGGKILSRADAARIVLAFSGAPIAESDLDASGKRSILYRMLRNLLGVAQRGPDREAMLRYLDAIVVVRPESVSDRGMRSIVRYETGRRDAAIADIDWIIDREPPGLDIDRLREMRAHFQSTQPR